MCEGEKTDLLKTYFTIWKNSTRYKRDRVKRTREILEQKDKLDNLMKLLKKHKREKIHVTYETRITDYAVPVKCEHETTNYKDSFLVQSNVIEELKIKIEEKERVIEDLTLGIMEKDALKSLKINRNLIRELFADCSATVKCKVGPPPKGEKLCISSQQATKTIRETQEKSLQRARNRQVILERKRIIEEQRKMLVEEALEKKRVQDEQEKLLNLQKLKEKRVREIEANRIRNANKAKFMEKWGKAIHFHNSKIVKTTFYALLRNYNDSKHKFRLSEVHCRMTTLRKVMLQWKAIIETKYEAKYKTANAIFARKILSRSFAIWKVEHLENVRSMQVAEDFYDYTLIGKVFVQWHRYVCVQFLKREKQFTLAVEHYKRRILFQCFHQWRTFPAVLQLEKAKEEKKKKWRDKVWEILPDYNPPDD